MTNSLAEIDSLLDRTQPVDESISAPILRQWRGELVRASVFVSYSIGVLSLDIEALKHSATTSSENVLQSLVDNLADILSAGWVGGGWSLSPDAATSVAAAAELAMDQSESLLGLHGELVSSDLNNRDVVRDLQRRIEAQRQELTLRRDELESRIRQIQATVQRHYASGAASVDDWLQ